MRNLLKLLFVLFVFVLASCEKSTLEDEMGEFTELQGTNKEDSINPGGDGQDPGDNGES